MAAGAKGKEPENRKKMQNEANWKKIINYFEVTS